MATATMEQPKVYVMPKACVGDRIHYYTDADPKMQPQTGIVVEAWPNCISCRLQLRSDNSPVKYDVRHITDPVLEANFNVRRNGSWNFHPDTLALRDLQARVEKLEQLIA